MEMSTAEKALSVNLVKPLNGTISEIGAGQEVARWFFKVGGAAGTIAKAMSAYDMTFSDDIYGREKSGRYVVESRVRKMLDHEYTLLDNRLSDDDKYFFAFANTVAAKSYKYTGDCHGWMGLRFQTKLNEDPSQVILHVRMLDQTNSQQQDALGVLGVNLIYACYNKHENVEDFLSSLNEGGIHGRIEINLVRFEGPLFQKVDPVTSHLFLLKHNLTHSCLFTESGGTSHLAEELYNKQVIIHRGQFNPPLKTDIDILTSARDHYCGDKTEGFCDPYLINEVYFDPEKSSFEDLTEKIRKLKACGNHILVTDFFRTFQLTEYIAQFTKNHINVVFRATKIIEILENERLASLDRLARIFNERTRMYIYPVDSQLVPEVNRRDKSKKLFSLSDYQPSELNHNLYKHLIASDYIQELTNFDPELALWDGDLYKKAKGDKKDLVVGDNVS